MIPKIIHVYDILKHKNETEFEIWVDNLKKVYPDFDIRVWTKDNIEIQNVRYIQECITCGKIGFLYLSYYYRFYCVYKYGGFYVDPLMTDLPNLYDLLDKKSIFCVEGFENINVDFFGYEKDMFGDVIKEYGYVNFINKNQSLNLYNPNQFIAKLLKNSGVVFDTYDDISKIESNSYLINIKDHKEYHKDYYYIPKEYIPKASVLIPIYNSQDYLTECLDSILNQSFDDYEIICVDDGSEDDSKDIIFSYNNDKIVYVNKKHSGIVDSLNIGLNRAIGDYIVRIDSDDVMLNDRMEYQIEFMETHNDVDILSNGYKQWFPNDPNKGRYFNPGPKYINMDDMYNGNKIAHPCVCLRRNSIAKLPYRYENYYSGAEDYKLWLTALSYDLKIYADPKIVTLYRQHDKQITKEKYSYLLRIVKIIKKAYCNNSTNNELTVIIPFQNEGHEIEKTVASIRGTSNTNILLIDDYSTDGYDYKKTAKIFNCEYIKTNKNLGVAACRDFGIQHCKTNHFLLLDGHMRFYDENWEVDLLKVLKSNPCSIVTGNTLVIGYDFNTGIYKHENQFDYKPIITRGASINTWEDGQAFTAKWTNKELDKDKDITRIACCMGAVYACNKIWWKHILGLVGLEKWGQDEPYMSIKSWLAGGDVLLIKNFGVGHLYRDMSAYLVPKNLKLKNRIFLIYFFLQDEFEIKHQLNLLKELIGEENYNISLQEFNKDKDYLLSLKEYFWKNVAVRDLHWFYNNINDKVI